MERKREFYKRRRLSFWIGRESFIDGEGCRFGGRESFIEKGDCRFGLRERVLRA